MSSVQHCTVVKHLKRLKTTCFAHPGTDNGEPDYSLLPDYAAQKAFCEAYLQGWSSLPLIRPQHTTATTVTAARFAAHCIRPHALRLHGGALTTRIEAAWRCTDHTHAVLCTCTLLAPGTLHPAARDGASPAPDVLESFLKEVGASIPTSLLFYHAHVVVGMPFNSGSILYLISQTL